MPRCRSSSPVNTCSIAFADPAFNESAFALDVAKRYRTNHHVEQVESDDFDLIDLLAGTYDEPYADSSAIPRRMQFLQVTRLILQVLKIWIGW